MCHSSMTVSRNYSSASSTSCISPLCHYYRHTPQKADHSSKHHQSSGHNKLNQDRCALVDMWEMVCSKIIVDSLIIPFPGMNQAGSQFASRTRPACCKIQSPQLPIHDFFSLYRSLHSLCISSSHSLYSFSSHLLLLLSSSTSALHPPRHSLSSLALPPPLPFTSTKKSTPTITNRHPLLPNNRQ